MCVWNEVMWLYGKLLCCVCVDGVLLCVFLVVILCLFLVLFFCCCMIGMLILVNICVFNGFILC